MLSHEEMVDLQADEHDLIEAAEIRSTEDFVVHTMHEFDYEQAALLARDKNVLDLGCNTGYGTEMLAKGAAHITGVDVSERAIAAARKRRGDCAEFQQVDGKRLPFEDGVFELVTSFQVVEHVVDYDLYLGEMRRVLAPVGAALMTTPNGLLRLDPGMKPWYKFHVREFSPVGLEELLQRYFPHVQVLGLYAEEPVYAVEAARVERAKQNARRKAARTGLKNKLPEPILKRLKSAKSFVKKMTSAADKEFLERHGTHDFFYRIEDREAALGLLAVCANDENVLREQLAELKIRSAPA